MQAGTGTIEYTSLQPENHQKRSTDYRLTHAAQGSVKEKKHPIQCKTYSLTELQQMKKEIQDSDQNADMKPADGENMGNSQPGKGLAVFRRNERTHSEKQSGSVGSGLFSERFDQGGRQPVTQGSKKAGKRKFFRILHGVFFFSVQANEYTALQKGFTEIIAIRIICAARVIQGSLKRNRFAGDQV